MSKETLPQAPVVKSDAEWRADLTPEEFHVLREAGTERPYTGEYTDNHRTGVYRCRACGNELFRSDHKFDSHCGWPSFYTPLAGENVILRSDNSMFMRRTEVLCAHCHSHLGHVFEGEGYGTPTDQRYCINSVSLTFEELPRVKLGLHIADFTWPGGPDTMGADLARIASAADDAGFARISVMDHVWQIGVIGPPEHDMLEAYTALGFLAAHTRKAQLLAWVTAVVYRSPGLLAKAVTTLDVLSGGRAMLGIGAAWNAEESAGLGLDFPPTAERFERLEEALQIYLQMCSDSEQAYTGKHYQLGRTLNVPQTLSRPHPPILIGGGGEKKTLRMVAQYADACNLFDVPELAHKLDVLRGHCEDLGRDYASVEKTVMMHMAVGPRGEGLDEFLAKLEELAALGIEHVHHRPAEIWNPDLLDFYADTVIPAAEKIAVAG